MAADQSSGYGERRPERKHRMTKRNATVKRSSRTAISSRGQLLVDPVWHPFADLPSEDEADDLDYRPPGADQQSAFDADDESSDTESGSDESSLEGSFSDDASMDGTSSNESTMDDASSNDSSMDEADSDESSGDDAGSDESMSGESANESYTSDASISNRSSRSRNDSVSIDEGCAHHYLSDNLSDDISDSDGTASEATIEARIREAPDELHPEADHYEISKRLKRAHGVAKLRGVRGGTPKAKRTMVIKARKKFYKRITKQFASNYKRSATLYVQEHSSQSKKRKANGDPTTRARKRRFTQPIESDSEDGPDGSDDDDYNPTLGEAEDIDAKTLDQTESNQPNGGMKTMRNGSRPQAIVSAKYVDEDVVKRPRRRRVSVSELRRSDRDRKPTEFLVVQSGLTIPKGTKAGGRKGSAKAPRKDTRTGRDRRRGASGSAKVKKASSQVAAIAKIKSGKPLKLPSRRSKRIAKEEPTPPATPPRSETPTKPSVRFVYSKDPPKVGNRAPTTSAAAPGPRPSPDAIRNSREALAAGRAPSDMVLVHSAPHRNVYADFERTGRALLPTVFVPCSGEALARAGRQELLEMKRQDAVSLIHTNQAMVAETSKSRCCFTRHAEGDRAVGDDLSW